MDQTGRFYIVASAKLPTVRKESATNGREAVSPINEVPLDPQAVLRLLNRHFTAETIRDLILPAPEYAMDPGRPQTSEALRILKDAWYQEATQEGTLVASRGFSRVENCRLNGSGEYQWQVKLAKKEPFRGTMDFATSLQGMTRSQLIRRLCVLWDIVHGMPPSLVAMYLRPKLQAALMFDPRSPDPGRLANYGFQVAEPNGAPPAVAWKRAQWKVLDLNCLGRPRLMDQGDMAMEDPPQAPHAQCFARLSNWVFSECEAVRKDLAIGLVADEGPEDIVLGGNYRFNFLVGNPPAEPLPDQEDEVQPAQPAQPAPRAPRAPRVPRVDVFDDDEANAGAPPVVAVPARRSSRNRRRPLAGGADDDADEPDADDDADEPDAEAEADEPDADDDDADEPDADEAISGGLVTQDMSLSDWEAMSMLSMPSNLTQMESQALARKGSVLKSLFQTRPKPKVITYETILHECGDDEPEDVDDVGELELVPGESVVPEFASTLDELTGCSTLILKLLVAQKIITASVGPKQVTLTFPGMLVPVRTKDSARTEHVLSSRGTTTFVLGSKRGMQTWSRILYAFYSTCRLGASLTILETTPFVHMDRRRSVRDSILVESTPRMVLPAIVVESLKMTPSPDRNFLYTWCRDFYRQIRALVE